MPLAALSPILAPYRAALEAAERPAVQLVPDPQGRAGRYGGTPRVAPGTRWPQGKDGPLTFVGELDLAAVAADAGPAAHGLPAEGVLSLFVELPRFPTENAHGDRWQLLYCPRAEDAVPLAVPEAPRPRFPASLFRRGRSYTTPERRLAARAAESLPVAEEADGLVSIPADAAEVWEEYSETLFPPDDVPRHQLLGYAQWIQSDGRATVEALSRGLRASASRTGPLAEELERASRSWRLLWQVDSDHSPFMWGDAGRLYVLVRDADLREARFDRAFLYFGCY